MGANKVCIDNVKKFQKDAQFWFDILTHHCEHHIDGLCQIPISQHEQTGVIVCAMRNCPIIVPDK